MPSSIQPIGLSIKDLQNSQEFGMFGESLGLIHRYHAQAFYISPLLSQDSTQFRVFDVLDRVSLHGLSCVKKIQLMLHEASKAALNVHKSLFFFAAHVSPEPHRASCQTVDQQCPAKQPQSSTLNKIIMECSHLMAIGCKQCHTWQL